MVPSWTYQLSDLLLAFSSITCAPLTAVLQEEEGNGTSCSGVEHQGFPVSAESHQLLENASFGAEYNLLYSSFSSGLQVPKALP